ncbi:MAG: roadblock/LC7 domain-containing protein [Deltaproteobacteria bacterium]|nr:roadblock/LC7 domain-containing protein [Deltaproteobacteria bacterium]
MNPEMVMYEREFQQIHAVCSRLHREANATAILLIDKNGQLIADAGDVSDLDTVSLSSLTAGNVAATGGIAKLLREKEFTGQFHEGTHTNVHMTLVASRVILVVLFDERSSLGLVRLRVKKASDELTRIFDELMSKVDEPSAPSIFSEITDEDIDNLFND